VLGCPESVHAKEGTGESIPIIGVWRLWCEHGGSGVAHVQGGALEPITDTNPDHVFEIHPVVRIGGADVIDSLGTISGFTEKMPNRRSRHTSEHDATSPTKARPPRSELRWPASTTSSSAST
jgi:hypothetical protein